MQHAAIAEETTLNFKASPDPGIREAQTQLVETYAYVNFYYYDPTFNGIDWGDSFQDALQASYKASSADEVRGLTLDLLGKLDDPFSKILPSSAAKRFQAEAAGKVVAYGLAAEYVDAESRCVVTFVADDSSAAAAGILVGDTLEAVDGRAMDAEVSRQLKDALQSREAEKLLVTVSRSDQDSGGKTTFDAQLSLSEVDVNPVQYSVLEEDDKLLGYIRIVVFADTVPASVGGALDDLLERHINGLILDLRDNPGGLVSSGYEVARQLLHSGDVLFIVSGRDNYEEIVLVQDSVAKPQMASIPMAVLVNHGTASTSEILSSALRAKKGAVLVGETTFGKGKSQKIIPLSDGSLLLLSVVSYLTADREPVDKVGITPGVECRPEVVENVRYTGGLTDNLSLKDDPCVSIALKKLSQ